MKPLWRGQTCHYCTDLAASWDHVIPRALGGSSWPDNLVPACLSCNGKKADSLPTCECQKCADALADYWEAVALRERYSRIEPLHNKIVIPLPQADHYRDL